MPKTKGKSRQSGRKEAGAMRGLLQVTRRMEREHQIPQFTTNRVNQMTFGFLATGGLTGGAAAGAVTDVNIQTLLGVATAAGAGNAIIADYRIRRIEIWAPPAGVASNNNLTLILDGGAVGERLEQISATSMGSTAFAHILYRPKRDTNLGWWNGSTSGTTQFSIIGPTNSIVHLDIEFTLATAVAGTAFTSAGLTAGQLYFGPLDGHNGLLVSNQKNNWN